MSHNSKADKYDKVIALFQKMGLLQTLVEKHTPTYNLERSVIDLKKRYPMLTVLDWHEFSYPWKEAYSITVFDYVNIIDITHHSRERLANEEVVKSEDGLVILQKKRENSKELA